MKLLVIGCKGQLDCDMVALSRKEGHAVGGVDFPQIDIADENSVAAVVKQHAPDAIINCAAYTAVDACETNQALAFAVNADGPGNIAKAAGLSGALVVHFSTDYVFDGTKTAPYLEGDPPNPQSVYGKSKFSGEQKLLAISERCQIFRIAWLYGIKGNNFVKTIRAVALKKQADGEPLKVVNDQFGSPTSTVQVCRQVLFMLTVKEYGVFHATAEGFCSWYDFARQIVTSAGIACEVVPCTTAEFTRPAPRPAFGVLENSRLKLLDRNIMADWKTAFCEYLEIERKA